MSEEEQGSEFGSGLVVCLVKFSEHLSDRMALRVLSAMSWQKMTPEERERVRQEAELYPIGDSARYYGEIPRAIEIYGGSIERYVSSTMELWANAASDHFYELDESAPESLRALANLTLTMGHGFTGQQWNEEDWKNIHNLWEQACLDLDERLGVRADWGTW